MDNQEIFNQIRELQKQRTLLSAQDTALVNKINELRDKIVLKNIKKGYYTDNNGLYCKVYDIKEDAIFVYEVNTSELPWKFILIIEPSVMHIVESALEKSMTKL